MTDRERVLWSIKVGDIFRATGDHGGPLICLTTAITETAIHARTVTHQLEFTFDRRTGVGQEDEFSIKGTIDSVAPLPPEIHETLLGLDHKNRTPVEGPLTENQKKALLFIAKFYPAHPIP